MTSAAYTYTPPGGLPQDASLPDHFLAYKTLQSLPEIWPLLAQRHGEVVAVDAPYEEPATRITYSELYQRIQRFAAGLQALGVAAGDRVALFADNSPRWLIADQGSMMAGAINVVRSGTAEAQELLYILRDSGATLLLIENLATLRKLQEGLAETGVETVVLLSAESPELEHFPLRLLNFGQVFTEGQYGTVRAVAITPDDLATLMYTSGTTGQPKGVMVTHGGLLSQIVNLWAIVQPQVGDRILSILPIWHAYERVAEYFLFACGCSQTYTNLRHFKNDLKRCKPHYLIAVPRIWEGFYEGVQKQLRDAPATKRRLAQFFLKPLYELGEKRVYRKIREATGGEIKQVISGGGALAPHLDTFYEVINLEVLVGYGLTETAVVLTARRSWANLRGSAGRPIPDTAIKIVDPETKAPVEFGQKGLVMAKGPQVMRGYYNKPEATAKVLDAEGWLDTGDLGYLTPNGDLVLTGRQKDTIVLSNGENIEPQPIEDACVRSAYIDQIMLVGQDQKALGALIVPNLEALEQWVAAKGYRLELPNRPAPAGTGELVTLESKVIIDLYRQELLREVQNRPGYRPDDRIATFRFVLEPFTIENGLLTQTLKIRRHVVSDRYRDMINAMFE
ncbi:MULTISPECIES: long-chain fatty acid--CoA ligase [unclassified Thermosynechococcus]|uniref:long-chain fatty acid--CoA ligase n=1 Tax=unclassified Thermosynechococcus TaxID=2622553 RepID=UPI002872B803|nr:MULTISPECIES: long-chain fatty acid--CoA ligase [unclassified Thermosynechococcus]WNC25398.1 long-chain fatty acid--CoA ligase [Thermosynechococcus sp. PP551]WNC27976.1 long-chain fatty acid--CoA ligase [Thermosynechococcus sp. PP555]